MSMYWYNGGFYMIPQENSIEISDEYWEELLEGQSQGKEIRLNADGYPVLIDPEPITIIKTDPTSLEIIDALKLLIKPQLEAMIDQDAVKNKVLFDTWKSKIGLEVQYKDRLYYNEELYRVLKTHIVKEEQTPDENIGVLYELIQPNYSGTREDPIPYQEGMTLQLGKYYIQSGKVYLCYKDLDTATGTLESLSNYVQVI